MNYLSSFTSCTSTTYTSQGSDQEILESGESVLGPVLGIVESVYVKPETFLEEHDDTSENGNSGRL